VDLGLSGLKAIITGGSRGIGRRTAEVLAEEGCAVGICARGADPVEETVRELEAKGVPAFGRAVDVADGAALKGWVEDAAEALGGLDIVIPNVSALGGGEGEEAWYRSFEVDLLHTLRTVEAALPQLEHSGAASIVIVSTVAAREVGPFEGPYGALKAALARYAAGLALQLAPNGVRVNVVSPGTIYIADGFWGGVEKDKPDFFAQAVAWNPLGRMGTADEVARSIAFLASPASSFTSGTNLLIDGALTRGVQM
jgi:3-oxoacyl-[acyl-carrier protein] reductase